MADRETAIVFGVGPALGWVPARRFMNDNTQLAAVARGAAKLNSPIKLKGSNDGGPYAPDVSKATTSEASQRLVSRSRHLPVVGERFDRSGSLAPDCGCGFAIIAGTPVLDREDARSNSESDNLNLLSKACSGIEYRSNRARAGSEGYRQVTSTRDLRNQSTDTFDPIPASADQPIPPLWLDTMAKPLAELNPRSRCTRHLVQ